MSAETEPVGPQILPLRLPAKDLRPHPLLGQAGMLEDLIRREDEMGRKAGRHREARKARAEELREELAGIRESIAAEGIKDALKVCQGRNGRWLILDGRHRARIAVELGLETVPCQEYPADQARQIVLAAAARRHISKGAKAYQAVSLFPEVATQGRGGDRANRTECGLLTFEALAKKAGVSERLITDAVYLYKTFLEREDARDHYEPSIHAGVALAKVKSGVASYIETGKLGDEEDEEAEDEADPVAAKSGIVLVKYIGRLRGIETSWRQWSDLTPEARAAATKVTVGKLAAAPAEVREALRVALNLEAELN
jgi:hypothetical protein